MTTFLTAQEMQQLINVDRSTVYRMAEDGRLPGVKVGRQWRFPADRVAAQLGLEVRDDARGDSPGVSAPGRRRSGFQLSELLAPGTAEPIAELLAEVFGVMTVITDLDGSPLTPVANQCGYYRVIGDRPESAAACVSGWRQLAAEPNIAPRFVASHLGFLCARTFVWVDLRPVGMIVVGGITPAIWPPPLERVEAIADEVGLDLAAVAEVIDQTWDVSPERQERILRQLPKFGDLVSQLASARSRLVAGSGSPHRREAS